ncbi:aminomethyltransferase [Spirochaetia bacterium]|nr:aminomethyltransferase [Spirochaetia bacterium]
MEKKTPLYNWHESHGGKIVPFAGFLLPVQYATGIITEHKTVRTKAGLFDVSHMAEFVIKGSEKAALENLHRIFTGHFEDMPIGRVRYTLLCNETGGIIDDLVVCKMEAGRYYLVVNAANHEKDFAWIKAHITPDVTLTDVSDETAQIAIQGPKAPAILEKLKVTVPQKYYTLVENGDICGIKCIISRTGYTGEGGFEIFLKNADAVKLQDIFMEAGAEFGIIPCGLGCRDTLRLEAAMPLYGHEMDDTTTPFEAGLGQAVDMSKKDFIGKSALAGKETPKRKRVGLRITGRGIVREHEDVYKDGKVVGKTTSGTFAPHLNAAIAMAIVETGASAVGTKLEVDVRGRKIEAEVCTLPFYKKN